jgi:hypothetical protein
VGGLEENTLSSLTTLAGGCHLQPQDNLAFPAVPPWGQPYNDPTFCMVWCYKKKDGAKHRGTCL